MKIEITCFSAKFFLPTVTTSKLKNNEDHIYHNPTRDMYRRPVITSFICKVIILTVSLAEIQQCLCNSTMWKSDIQRNALFKESTHQEFGDHIRLCANI